MGVSSQMFNEISSASAGAIPTNIQTALLEPRIDDIKVGFWRDMATPTNPIPSQDMMLMLDSGKMEWTKSSRMKKFWKPIKHWRVSKVFKAFPQNAITWNGSGVVYSNQYFAYTDGYYKRLKWRGRQFCQYNLTDGKYMPLDVYMIAYSNLTYNFGTVNSGRSIAFEGRVYYEAL